MNVDTCISIITCFSLDEIIANLDSVFDIVVKFIRLIDLGTKRVITSLSLSKIVDGLTMLIVLTE